MSDHLSKSEIGKDAVQSALEAGATTVGEVATILTRAVRDVATAVGNFATEVYEIREAAQKASDEHERPAPTTPDPDPGADPDPRV